jgi:hypothetical protein
MPFMHFMIYGKCAMKPVVAASPYRIDIEIKSAFIQFGGMVPSYVKVPIHPNAVYSAQYLFP